MVVVTNPEIIAVITNADYRRIRGRETMPDSYHIVSRAGNVEDSIPFDRTDRYAFYVAKPHARATHRVQRVTIEGAAIWMRR